MADTAGQVTSRMAIDRLAPEWDGTRIEHALVEGDPELVYETVMAADFLRAWRESRLVTLLFALRSLAQRAVAALMRRPFDEPEEPEAMRLADMPARGDWVLLDADPPREVTFGVVVRFWSGETVWEEIDSADFRAYDRPGFAKIACNFSLRAYGEDRTLVSYEARTVATDPESRRSFLRYWRVVSPFVGIVMRSMLRIVAGDARRACRAHR